MRAPFSSTTALVLAAALAVAGCGGESDGASSSTTTTTSSATSGTSGGDAGPELVRMSVAFIDARTSEPLVALDVCVAGNDGVPCGKTGDDGLLTMDLPAAAEILLACTIDTHVPTYMTLKTPAEAFDVGVFRLLDTGTAQIFVSAAGATQGTDQGIVIANVYEDLVERDERVAGATFSSAPQDGLGPVYGGALGLPDPNLEATSEGGPAAFFELPPGPRTVTIAHPDASCAGGFGWPTDAETSLRTEVFAGAMSTVTFVCPP
jgi:hypothetical protein